MGEKDVIMVCLQAKVWVSRCDLAVEWRGRLLGAWATRAHQNTNLPSPCGRYHGGTIKECPCKVLQPEQRVVFLDKDSLGQQITSCSRVMPSATPQKQGWRGQVVDAMVAAGLFLAGYPEGSSQYQGHTLGGLPQLPNIVVCTQYCRLPGEASSCLNVSQSLHTCGQLPEPSVGPHPWAQNGCSVPVAACSLQQCSRECFVSWCKHTAQVWACLACNRLGCIFCVRCKVGCSQLHTIVGHGGVVASVCSRLALVSVCYATPQVN